MLTTFTSASLLCVWLLCVDRPASQRAWTSLPGWIGLLVLLLVGLGGFGLFLALSGNTVLAALCIAASHLLLRVVSKAKQRVLGEPLLFSDLALLSAVVKHPQFYFSALHRWQIWAMAASALALVLLFLAFFDTRAEPHFLGLAICAGSVGILAWLLELSRHKLPLHPMKPAEDVASYGLIASIVLHWITWRKSVDPAPYTAPSRQAPDPADATPDMVIIVQCESFADPANLFGDQSITLPELEAARENAWLSGDLLVSGFGAYTMRTEYGLIFGRGEDELEFRRFDPFLTAARDASYSLPAKLKPAGWTSVFAHPHDMQFYGREKILSLAGFDQLIGETQFARPAPDEGRYVTDRVLGEKLVELARNAKARTLIYAVTIENHGPWQAEDKNNPAGVRSEYLHLLQHTSKMVGHLQEAIAGLSRPALLVFFGDHRPSLPGVNAPGGDIHTPFVVLRTDGKHGFIRGDRQSRRLVPAQLHHTVLDLILGRPLEDV